MTNIGKILETEITTEMQKSYLDYAMSVIVARALLARQVNADIL